MVEKIYYTFILLILGLLFQYDLRVSYKNIKMGGVSIGVYFYFTMLLFLEILFVVYFIEMWIYDISFITS
jgi:hypothetical protein